MAAAKLSIYYKVTLILSRIRPLQREIGNKVIYRPSKKHNHQQPKPRRCSSWGYPRKNFIKWYLYFKNQNNVFSPKCKRVEKKEDGFMSIP